MNVKMTFAEKSEGLANGGGTGHFCWGIPEIASL